MHGVCRRRDGWTAWRAQHAVYKTRKCSLLLAAIGFPVLDFIAVALTGTLGARVGRAWRGDGVHGASNGGEARALPQLLGRLPLLRVGGMRVLNQRTGRDGGGGERGGGGGVDRLCLREDGSGVERRAD